MVFEACEKVTSDYELGSVLFLCWELGFPPPFTTASHDFTCYEYPKTNENIQWRGGLGRFPVLPPSLSRSGDGM